MRYVRIITGSLLLVLVASLTFLQPGSGTPFVPDNASRTNSAAQPGAQVATGEVVVSEPVVPVLTMPARDVPDSQPEPRLDREINPRVNPYGRNDPATYIEGGLDPLVALQANAPAASDRDFDTPLFNFEGQGYTFVNPPDTVGDVGIDHYIQMINATEVAVYDKDTAALIDSFSLTSLGGCSTGGGDPVVLYDEQADRWLLSEFGPGNSLCVFISQTADPLGSYYSYQFNTPNFPDYPKYGVWTDAYYVTTNEASPANYAFDRDAMLAGDPATSQRFTAPDLSGFGFQALTPADVDGTPPPAGSPGYFMRHRDTEAHGPGGFPTEDFLEVWAFDVDWDTPANSTFTQVANISITEFDSHICSLTAFNGIPMPGAAKCAGNSLDPIREVVMFRLQYRNFGGYETLVGNLVTDATGSDDAGIRWFELRKSGGDPWELHQEGTYFPGDGNARWMGAIAMDASGNIALGYNVSGPSVFPSLRYAGRLASDPPGTMPQGEYDIVDGAGNNSSFRYGDYAALSVDPEDGCTFWFTGEYNPTSQWSTRIAAFKFDACGGPFHVEATPPSLEICAPDDAVYSVHVALDMPGFSDPVDLDVLNEPAGTTATFSVDNQAPPYTSTLTIGNTGAATPGDYSLSITGSGPTSTVTATVGLSIFDAAATVSLVSPADGTVDTPIDPSFEWSGTGTSYTIEIATDAAFNDIVETATVGGTTYSSSGLDPETTYYWRVTANNDCGGSTSETWSFTTMGVPPILLVDDDDNSPDVQATYTAALDALGLEYDIWDTNNSDTEPNAAQLSPYQVVIWFTGDEFGGASGPGSSGETALGTWLDGGGCLFISSQDYYYDRGLTDFMDDYLGVSSATSDVTQTSVTGAGSVYSGLGPYALSYPFNNYSDVINPDGAPAELAFSGNAGNAAVNKDAGTYRTTFWGFPWEAIGTSAGREEALQATLDWCGELASYDVNLSGNQSAEGQPGETVDYTVTVTNNGNVTDTIDLAVSGETWTTTLSVSSVELGAGESTDITVSVEIPGDALPGDSDTATVTGTSAGNPGESDSMTVTTSVPEEQPAYGVDVSGDTGEVGLPGSAVSYEVTVTNTGSSSDTFDLVISGNAWATTISENSVTLDSGESVVVLVEVTIPGDAEDGDMDTVTVTATSTGDPGVSDSHDITTTATTTPPVPEYRTFLPVMLKQP